MNTVQKMTTKLFLGLALFGIATVAAPASALTLDPEILKLVNEAILKKQSETMAQLYPTMPFKDQMRGKMMIERASGNYLQDVIQPKLMQENMGKKKEGLMKQMLDK
jgi:hypothetical protein